MSDPSYELQAAIVPTLKAVATIAALVGARVYDDVPAAGIYPYVTLGPSQVLPDKADCIDGAEVFVQVDVWSRSTGFGETKKIAAAVMIALDDQPMDVSGNNVIVFEHQSTNYLNDPDGKTRHAALSFRVLINPT